MGSRGRLHSQTVAAADAVHTVLDAVLDQRTPADRALLHYFRTRRHLGSRDRRLISGCVMGVLRWLGWLREAVPADSTDTTGWSRLFLSLAAIEKDARQPIHDAWCEAAGVAPAAYDAAIAAATPGERLQALWPGEGADLRSGTPPDADLFPAWVPDAVQSPVPFAEWTAWMQRRPPIWLRLQTDSADAVVQELRAAGLDPVRHPRLPDAVNIGHAQTNLQALPGYRNGNIEVQDLASQAVVAVCGVVPGASWWDACAGAGGKTLALARGVGPDGRVLATEPRPEALRELAHRTGRAGLGNVETHSGNAAELAADARFDGVLVDAPCTGSGTWRRAPWARWQVASDDVARFAAGQVELLAAAAEHVRPGGTLVYATCSQFTVENADVVQAFLATHADFAPEPFEHPLTGEQTAGRVTIWPWDGDCDVMFVARLRRAD